MQPSSRHSPVLLQTVLHALQPHSGECVLDATLGLGGHAAAFLEAIAPNGTLIGFDADAKNLSDASEHLREFSDRLTVHHCNFGEIGTVALPPLDIIFADLGLSSPHVDDPERGFSFRESSPLDLRFDQSTGVSAEELIRQSDTAVLKTIFRDFGELYQEAHRLAGALAGKTFVRTTDVTHAVEQAFGYRAKRILPQVFQSLRIAVNDELTMLDRFLVLAPLLLQMGGRIGIISFHSLEDRRVKQAFRALVTPIKNDVTGQVAIPALFEEISHKAMIASAEECADNPRARSAKFRAVRRLSF